MKVSAFLTDLNSKIDSNASESDQLEWINKLEQTFYRSNLMEVSTAFISIVANQATYSLTATAYKFEDIEKLIVDGVDYDKRIAYTDDQNYTYYKSGTNLILIPTPVTAKPDGIEVRYLRKPAIKTSADKATQDLSITADFGDEFLDIYRHFCKREACISNREYADANLYGTLYMEIEDAFWKWYVDRLPKDMANHRKARWR